VPPLPAVRFSPALSLTFGRGASFAGTARRNCGRLTDRRIRRLRANAPFASTNRGLPRQYGSAVHVVLLLTRRAYGWR
jgi:hypothetical protein